MISKEIKRRFNLDITLIKGEGYYYFVADNSPVLDKCKTTSVMVNSLNQLSLESWLADFESLITKE
jgi:hypothetical protein